MGQTSCVLLWNRPGMETALAEYEDAVILLVGEHGGEILQRVRGDGRNGNPLEVQLYEWPSATAREAYMSDPRRTAMAEQRARAIARTEMFPVELV
jgi:hypothetical protein